MDEGAVQQVQMDCPLADVLTIKYFKVPLFTQVTVVLASLHACMRAFVSLILY